MNKGGRILVQFSSVLVLWAIITVFLSIFTVHSVHQHQQHDRDEAFPHHHHPKRRSSTRISSGSHKDKLRTKIPYLEDNPSVQSQQRLFETKIDKHDSSSNGERWVNREALMKAWSERKKQLNGTSSSKSSSLHHQHHQQQQPQQHHGSQIRSETKRLTTITRGTMSTTEVQQVTPKVYDAMLVQDSKKVCVQRDLKTKKCRLQSCHLSPSFSNTSTASDAHDDYGFALHDTNTRGRRMLIGGMASSGSGCALSHKYKFIYIHVLKSGGMTMKAFLKKGLCQGSVSMPCASGPDALQIVDCATAVLDHPTYFVFSFIRNPFARMYSAYSMAENMKVRRKKTGLNFKAPAPPPKIVPFRQFVSMTNHERRRVSLTSTSHYAPQVQFLFDGNQCPVFDFLGRLESFQQDLQIILHQINSPELLDYYYYYMNGNNNNKNNATNSLHENSTNFGERRKEKELGGNLSNAYDTTDVIQAVVQEFNYDFEWLRYDSQKVP